MRLFTDRSYLTSLLIFYIFLSTNVFALSEDESTNNSCPTGQVILNTSTTSNALVSDAQVDRDFDYSDYYTLSFTADGTLDISLASNKNIYLLIGNSCDGTTLYDGRVKTKTHSQAAIPITAGSSVYVKAYLDNTFNNSTRTYTLNADFTAAPSPDPIAEYRFDECSWDGNSDEVKDSIGSVHGQSYNGADINSSDALLCSSALFDGDDDHLSMGDSFNDIFGSANNSFSITAWIKAVSLSSTTSNHGTANTIIAKASDSANDNLEIGVNTDGTLHIYLDTETDTNEDFGATGSIMTDRWNFIALSYDGTAMTVTINGTTYASGGGKGTIADAAGSPFTIGTTLHSDTSFNGLIDEVKIFDSALSSSMLSDIFTNEGSGNDYTDNSRECQDCLAGYCETNNLVEGFHIIDPDGGDDKNSYEIYCDMSSAQAPRELISLPLKNFSNNMVFTDDTPDVNYYSEAQSGDSFSYLQIKIATDNTIHIIPDSIAEESSSNAGYFSNINLIGTPFAIDWDNTTLSNCNTSKLRKGSWDQAVKINTLDMANGRCKVEGMQLRLLDDYQYLTFDDIDSGGEILEETCRQIFEKIPDDSSHLPTVDGESNGHFWIDPDEGGRVGGDTVTTLFRPFVAYCKYQEDIDQAWTFVIALDAKVTNSKDDIKTMEQVRNDQNTYHDTCSQLGLLFYVPNSQDTFERTKNYLSLNKQEWIDYTGTIREKYKMYKNNPDQEYYIKAEGFNEIWPYGPFGVYNNCRGDKIWNGSSCQSFSNWGDGGDSPKLAMSSRCMKLDGACDDHPGGYSLPDGNMDLGNLGDAGWRTTLMDQVESGLITGITDGDKWWVSDKGAGGYLDCSGGGCSDDYYEPNGNYTPQAWLNWIADENGDVYHDDDNNDFYSYYDYMCMAWDNYYSFQRYGLTIGPFTVDEHDPALTTGDPIPNDLNITTKIVGKPLELDALLFDDSRTQIIDDQNISAGLFLVGFETINEQEKTIDLHYYGQIGANDDFNLSINPRGIISLNDESPYPNTQIDTAVKRLAFQYKYCLRDDILWTGCWTTSGSDASTAAICTDNCTPNDVGCACKVAESDDFAVRPEKFNITTPTALIVKAGVNLDVTYSANIYGSDTITALDYNESTDLSVDVNITLADPTVICKYTSIELNSTVAFEDGQDIHPTSFDHIGAYHINIHEVDGTEFAKVDADDTNDSARFIVEFDDDLTVIPDHFDLTIFPKIDHGNGFTYLSNDLDSMAVRLDVNITAKRADGVTTENYTDGCYAKSTSLKVHHGAIPGTQNLIDYKEATSDINGSKTPGTDLTIPGITPTVFTIDNNGTAELELLMNFGRVIDTPIDPFKFTINDLNVTDTDSVSVSDSTVDLNATMYYGRVHTSRNRVGCVNSAACTAIIPLYYEIYASNSSDPLIANVSSGNLLSIDDINWYQNTIHTTDDGNITGRFEPKNISAISNFNNSLNDSVVDFKNAFFSYTGNKGYPYKTSIDINASEWLIYHRFNNTATKNSFELEFNSAGNVAGKHIGVSGSDSNASINTNRRITW